MIAYAFDGGLLSCGAGYKDTPDGFVLVLSMKGENYKLKNQFFFCANETT